MEWLHNTTGRHPRELPHVLLVPSLHAALQLEAGYCVSKTSANVFSCVGWRSPSNKERQHMHAKHPKHYHGSMYANKCCQSKPCVDIYACYDCRFGLSSLRSSSNIFFTNGIYDPFTACGPTVNISDTITATIYGRGITPTLIRSMLSYGILA